MLLSEQENALQVQSDLTEYMIDSKTRQLWNCVHIWEEKASYKVYNVSVIFIQMNL